MLPSSAANMAELYECDADEHDGIHQREEEERTNECSKEDNLILDETAVNKEGERALAS
jgi:hypothetical protein